MLFPITVSPSMPQSGLAGGTVQGRGGREGTTQAGLATAAPHPRATHTQPCVRAGRELHSQAVSSSPPRAIHPTCLPGGATATEAGGPRSSQAPPLPATRPRHWSATRRRHWSATRPRHWSAPDPQRAAEWPCGLRHVTASVNNPLETRTPIRACRSHENRLRDGWGQFANPQAKQKPLSLKPFATDFSGRFPVG